MGLRGHWDIGTWGLATADCMGAPLGSDTYINGPGHMGFRDTTMVMPP